MRFVSFAVLLLALSRAAWAAGANEDTALRPGGRDSSIAYSQQIDPLLFQSALPGLGILHLGGEFLDSAPPGPDNSSWWPQKAPRDSAGFFMLHEAEHKPAGGDPGGTEADEGTKGWFGIELVFMIIDADGEILASIFSGEEEDSGNSAGSEGTKGEREADGGLFGLNFSFGFGESGREAFGMGLIGEVGYLNGDFLVADEEFIDVEGIYYLVGPSLRFGDDSGGGSLDLLVGKVDDPRISTLFNLRFTMRAGVGPVSSGFYAGLTVGLLYIGFEEDFSSELGDLNLLFGLVLGGQF